MRHLAVLLLAAVLWVACGGSAQSDNRPSPHAEQLDMATRAWASGDPERAVEILSQVFEHDSKSFDAVYRRGVLRVHQTPRDALRDLQQAAALDPSHPGPPVFSGIALSSLSDFTGAQRAFNQGFQLAERRQGYSLADTSDAAREGLRALTVGRPLAAREAFGRALQDDRKNPALWYLFGAAALRAGLNDSCRVAAEQALKLRPRFPAAQSLLAATYVRDGETEPALRHLEQALDADPRLADAYHQRALLALKRSEYRDAATDLWVAMLEDPTVIDVYFSLGRALGVMRESEMAVSFLQNAEWIKSAADRYHDRIPGR